MDFKQRLKRLRKENNVTQSQLATAIGITDRACRRYESGENEPTMSVINAIAEYFKVSTDYLLGNGIFAKEKIILQYKEKIIESLCSFYDTDFFSKIAAFPDNQFMTLLSSVIRDVHFEEKDDTIYIDIYPRIPPENID